MNILDFIPFGKQNAVSTEYLKDVTGLDMRTIRQQIANARMRGAVICSSLRSEGGGYFQPESPEEAAEYVRTERCRIESAKAALASAEEYVHDIS
ncbi:MAG: hypothetical protein IJ265_01455 [Oscillospiraceae bacterium]|nr:hypothetical protein [Oscillospiraceae bacterium]